MTWDEIAAQAGVALLVVRDGAVQRSNPAALRLVEPYGATLDDVLDRVTAVPSGRAHHHRAVAVADRRHPLVGHHLLPARTRAGSLYVIVDETARYGEDAQSLGPLTAQWRLAPAGDA